ncbi:MAG: hypothetical protein J6866_00440, partial [Victivallales bacterium]|nr:hypothetical protein [Victivallales bacterium]
MDNHWDMANDPLHLLTIAKARVHWDIMGLTPPKEDETPLAPTGGGVGPGLAFGRAMYDETGVPQGLIPCGHGGTTMTLWDPARRAEGDLSLYGAMLERFRLNGGKVTGVIWYQGESDARAEDYPLFAGRMDNFLSELRKDLHDENLPFIQVQLAKYIVTGDSMYFSAIRQAQLDMDTRIPRVATVPAIDLPMEDDIHVSAKGQEILGRRLADAACALLGIGNHLLPIRPVRAEICTSFHGPAYLKQIQVTFENMVGCLSAPGVPTGFTIDGLQAVVKMEMLPNKVILLIRQGLQCREVAYGRGNNPYCNLTDAMGRSLPAFTLPIRTEMPRTKYAEHMRVSMPDLRDDDLAKLNYQEIPADEPGNGYFTQKSDGCFIIPFNRIDTPHEPGFRYFRVKYQNPVTQKLKLSLGYDGPVKVFMDGELVHANPDGTNPIIPDLYSVPLEMQAGEHEIVIAEVLHNGNAYGVCLAIEGYKDTPEDQMPTLLPLE